MTINGINGVNTQIGQMGMNQATDAYSRNIQNQIAEAQKQLRELSSNEDMTLEEKMKKRQEIQQKINDLNMQLKQHQIEQRRLAQNHSEKQQAKSSSMSDTSNGTSNAESKNTGLSHARMTAMISADSSIKQAKIQGGVATEMKGKAGVLDSEIKLDKVRGNDTQAKEEELAEVEQKAQAAATLQLSLLADAGRTMKEAARADSKIEKTDNKDTDVEGKDEEENVPVTGAQEDDVFAVEESENTQSDNSVSGSVQTAEDAAIPLPTAYTPVDIRL